MARILLVDDVRATREMIRLALSSMGHEVISTEFPLAVPNLVRHQIPDLMLIDYYMPILDGVSLLHRLCTEFGSRCPKAIFVSAAPWELIMGGPKRTAAVGYVRRPFRLSALRRAIEHALEGGTGSSEMGTGENPTQLN
jgi:CheY-like chemotaxis protein